MLNFVIIIILLSSFVIGYKRGFILQLIHLTSFFISFIIAYVYYEKLAPKLVLWVPFPQVGENIQTELLFNLANLDDVYYRGIAFLIIFFGVKISLHIIGSMLDFVANIPILKQLNIWAGGLLGFVEVYLILFLILYIVAIVPIEFVQSAINNSSLAKGIIQHTPIFSKQIFNLWFNF